MVHPIRQVLQTLVQRATERHVEFLKAPADRQQGNAPGHGGADQRQSDAVSRGIFRRALGVRRAVVEFGLDVGPAAGQDDAIQAIEQCLNIRSGAVGGEQDGDGADHLIGRTNVCVGGRMIRHSENTELLGAATDADQRLDDAG